MVINTDYGNGSDKLKKVFCNIKELMKKKHLNIKTIQQSTGLSRTTISNLINQHSNGIQFDTLATLCGILECDISELLVLHEFDLKFNVLDTTYVELENNEDSIEELLEMILECYLLIDNEKYNIEFKIECRFWYQKNNSGVFDIDEINPSIIFNRFISQNKFPIYIEEIIEKEMRCFVEDWLSIYTS